MANWREIILSGSNAELNKLNISTELTASGLKYPTSDGSNTQVLQTDGSGNLTFVNKDSGPKGEKGEKGDQGPKGSTGTKGQDGTKGSDGPKGEKGQKGQKGQGDTGPKGEPGPKGDQGPKGSIGPKGESENGATTIG